MSTKEITKNMKVDESPYFTSDSGDESNDYQQYESSKKQSTKSIKRVKFLPSEDKTIIDLVSIYGTDWKLISQSFGPSRTKRQLRERWQNYLNPECNPTYTEEEDIMLVDLVNEMGTKWAKIAEIIGKKSAISCRNRHRILIKEKNKKSHSRASKCSSNQKNSVSNNENCEKNNLNQNNESNVDSKNNQKDQTVSTIDQLLDESKIGSFDDDSIGSFFFNSVPDNEVGNNYFDYEEYLFDIDPYFNI